MTVIAGRYQLLDELGAGGMGTVFKGIDLRSQESVAVKRLHAMLTTSHHIQRFVREGEALRKLNHPNIVKLLDSVQEGDEHYLVMDYISGGDLSHLLAKGQLPISRILDLALDIADALTRVHRLDIVHRDLKPSNVLIASDDTPRLTDFGIAFLESEQRLTAPGAVVGTVDYLPPEALQTRAVDVRSDIWAFGVMLFEMLGGERPFKGDSFARVIKSVLFEPLPDLESLRPDAPKSLIDLVYRMLEKDPDDRIPSVRLVGAELDAIRHGTTTQPTHSIVITPIPPNVEDSPPVNNPTTPIVVNPPPMETNAVLAELPKHNLPALNTPFIGREPELQELGKLLNNPQVRLITILAPGGMGKTSLSVETARRQLVSFSSGAYFVGLATLNAPDSILPAISEAVSFNSRQEGSGRSAQEQILDFLGEKDLLLVMDNFEHLTSGATVVQMLLDKCPNLKILATSRERLNLSREQVYELGGMDVPSRISTTNILDYSAMQLFTQSARRMQTDFDPGKHLAAMMEVCNLVDGMPLGIVLAASWISMLTPEEIAKEVRGSVDFLETDLRDVPERQRSIRAVFEYSWRLLSSTEQSVLMKLSLFHGGFTREAADAVAGANLRVLMSLMNKSLISRSRDTGRYSLHSLTRQYSAEKLQASGEADSAERIYSTYYLEAAGAVAGQIVTREETTAVTMYEQEADNMRAAWRIAVQKREFERLAPVIEPLIAVYTVKGWHQEGNTLFNAALQALPDQTSVLAADLLTGIAAFEFGSASLVKAETAARGAIALYRQHNRNDRVIRVLSTLAAIRQAKGSFADSETLAREALQISESIKNQHWINTVTVQLGLMVYHQQKTDEARVLLEQHIQSLRATASYRTWGMALELLISLTDAKGDRPKARAYIKEMLDLSKANQHWSRLAAAYSWLTVLDIQEENFASAKGHAQKSLDVAIAADDRYLIASAEGEVSFLCAMSGDLPGARRHLRLGMENAASVIPKRRAFTPVPFICLRSGQPDRALEYASLLLNQPNLEIILKRALEGLNAGLKAQFPPAIYEAVWEKGKSRDFDIVYREMLDAMRRGSNG